MSGAVKLPCSTLTFILTFFQMQLDKIRGRAPHPWCGGSPEKEVKPDISSQDAVGTAVLSPDAALQTWFTWLVSPPGAFQDSVRKPRSSPFEGTIQPGLHSP
ncbi:uncharacterized protein FYW23_012476 [Sylvia borin]